MADSILKNYLISGLDGIKALATAAGVSPPTVIRMEKKQVIRNGVTLIAPNANTWPHYVLSMEKNVVVVIFDVRCYERETLCFAEMAKERKT